MGNKGRGEKTKMNKGRREGQGERANNNKEFSYVFVWCLFRSLIGPKSGQNPKKKKHPNLQPHFSFSNLNFEREDRCFSFCQIPSFPLCPFPVSSPSPLPSPPPPSLSLKKKMSFLSSLLLVKPKGGHGPLLPLVKNSEHDFGR